MLSKTVQDGLNDYDIGAKVRALRLKKKIGLVDLGKHTGLSAALLSKIERGRLFPTLPTLLRIALVFGVGLEYFFAGAREKPLIAVTNSPAWAFRWHSLSFAVVISPFANSRTRRRARRPTGRSCPSP